MTVDIILPVYKPDKKLRILLERLQKQTLRAQKIILVNTEKRYFNDSVCVGIENVEVHHISAEMFDHGGTRRWAASMSDADIIVCMTQDAVPANEFLLEQLVKPFHDKDVWAAYARQLPEKECGIVERYTRSFNYPKESRIKSKEDLKTLGIKTFFCSNVCAAYRKTAYEDNGGFVEKTIFNEDMILAGKMILNGGKVAYAADAEVIHSHNYTWRQQFHRNFDMAVSQTEYPEIFRQVSSEKEGGRLVKNTAAYLIRIKKPWLIISLVGASGFKYLGYLAGKNYRKLPKQVVRKCTMNPRYWEKKEVKK